MDEDQAQGEHVISDQRGRKYVTSDEPDGVVVLAKKEDAFLLIKQYRPAVDAVVVQLPGGGVEPGETLVQAARRELAEETGYTCGLLNYLGTMLPASWRSNDRTHVFFTDDLNDQLEQQLEDHESIQVYFLPITECIHKVKNNTLSDGELSFALFQAHLHGYSPVFN
ncbi:NUDIX hydrolase [Marinococcus luteus]|uniref:NUDIX hydrolase n=1 Tax=Marinococcus luteus TaxID=1122204 RepID=UPI002ACC65A9|nr:NUDIX hydrolase [Marinococcus luteus]MDZ5781928.1 NUDIX hydrolase [Marinococcus luteus]